MDKLAFSQDQHVWHIQLALDVLNVYVVKMGKLGNVDNFCGNVEKSHLDTWLLWGKWRLGMGLQRDMSLPLYSLGVARGWMGSTSLKNCAAHRYIGGSVEMSIDAVLR